jgi:hypothetical protein
MGSISNIKTGMYREEPGLLVFHPDCGGMLRLSHVGFYCEECLTRVSQRDRQRIIHEFQRPGAWKPMDPDPWGTEKHLLQ